MPIANQAGSCFHDILSGLMAVYAKQEVINFNIAVIFIGFLGWNHTLFSHFANSNNPLKFKAHQKHKILVAIYD